MAKIAVMSIAIVLAGCGRSNSPTTTQESGTNTTESPSSDTTAIDSPPKEQPPPASQPVTASTSSTTLIPETKPIAEKYEKVDPLALSMVCELGVGRYVRNADGSVASIDAIVKTFTVAGKPVDLITNKIAQEGEDTFIVTKNLGKIKIEFENFATESTIWLTASQKASVMKMAKSP